MLCSVLNITDLSKFSSANNKKLLEVFLHASYLITDASLPVHLEYTCQVCSAESAKSHVLRILPLSKFPLSHSLQSSFLMNSSDIATLL